MKRTQAEKNAYQRRWRAVQRAALRQAGLCRDCQRPSAGRARCLRCAAPYLARPNHTADAFNASVRELTYHAQPRIHDRRQGGHNASGLAWALTLRQY